MFDLFTTASSISAWPFALPAKLKTAIQVFDESAYVEYEAFPPKVDTITLKNLSEVTVAYARDRAVEAVWNQAKQMIRSQLAQQVLRVAQECAEDIRKSETVEFNKVVAEFVENVKLLPDSLDSSDLIRAGGDVVNTYHKAADAATRLAKYDQWVASLYGLPKWAGNDHEPYLRLTKPSTRKQYRELVNTNSDSGIPGNLLYAAKNDVPIVLHLPNEVTELRDHLNSLDEPSAFPGMAKMVDGRIVKADGVTPVGA